MDDYDDKYQFKMEALDERTGKRVLLEQEISVAEVYDVKGYQHRYVIKKFLDDNLQKFNGFVDNSKKNK